VHGVDGTTDAGGRFQFDGIYGTSFSISDIEKEGYEFRKKSVGRCHFEVSEYQPDPAKPEVFRIRRREPTTFVLLTLGAAEIHSPEQVLGIDVLPNGLPGIQLAPQPSSRLKDYHVDLKYSAVFLEREKAYRVRFEVMDDSGGVQTRKVELFEAPEAGYKPEVSILAPTDQGDPQPVYLYLKSRNPALYSRLDLTFFVQPDRLHVEMSILVNPYGERSLEMDPEVSKVPELHTELRRQTERVFRQGKRPVKPDLSRLIREAREKKRAASAPSAPGA
jgi:hypothetical protein